MDDLTPREVAELINRAVAILTRRGQGLLADGLAECLRRARDREHLLAALAGLRRRVGQAEEAYIADAQAAGRERARLRGALAHAREGRRNPRGDCP